VTETKETLETEEAATPPSPEPPEPVQDFTFGATLLQFFVIPMMVVAVCVGIFLFFGWMVAEEKTGLEYLNEVRTGSQSRRWQAAFELAKWLGAHQGEEEAAALTPAMVEAFRSARQDDPRVRRYLALCLGYLRDARARPLLVEALSDEDVETRIYAIWALGSIGDPSDVGAILNLVKSDDPAIRKMAVYSLGAMKAQAARPLLIAALEDPTLDVAWNAAIALAQLGDSSGRERILQMLDRSFLDGVAEMTEEQKAQAMLTAMKGAVLLPDPELHERLEAISRSDPNLKVRQSAFEALAERRTRQRTSR
jgi:HEAT repeat protein